MELRDYLMPGEYILGVMHNVNINNGEFHNIAVTNKRFIVFNAKKRGLLKKVQEITKMESLPFENGCGIRIKWRKRGLKTERVILDVCWRVYRHSAQRLGCTGASNLMITGSSLGRTSPDDVLSMLSKVFNSIAHEKDVWDESIGKDEIEYTAIYVLKENCVE